MKKTLLEILENNMNSYISGQDIATSLNMTRANVWKEIQKLKNQGYTIDSIRNKGYRLISTNDILNSQRIINEMVKFKADQVHVFEEIGSTNDFATKLALENPSLESALIVSNTQSLGRGRRGRSFYSPSNSGIYMSILLRPSLSLLDTQLFTIAAAVSLKNVIYENLNVSTSIKWLNDLYLNQRKVAGILTEGEIELETSSYKHLVIGIGINISNPDCIPEDIRNIYGSISSNINIDRNKLIARIYERIMHTLSSLPHSKFQLIEEYKRSSLVLGKLVKLSNFGDRLFKALDISEYGHLIVEDENGEITELNSGEISVVINSL